MNIVIDIPEDRYETLKMLSESRTFYLDFYQRLIINGTPLPKGHDALIDRKNVIDVIEWYRLNPQHFSIDNVIDDIKCMEFLVEADKEGEEDDTHN